MLKASVYCAFTITILVFFFGFIKDPSPVEVTSRLVSGMFIAATIIWVVSFTLCMILLVPLSPVFKRTPLGFSIVLFAIIGFFIPTVLGYWVGTIPAHGEMPELYKEDNVRAILSIVSGGVIGAIGAVTAWYSLKQDMRKSEA